MEGRERPDCPSWCVSTPDEHAGDEPGSWLHEGPRFGLLRSWWLEGEPDRFLATVDESDDGAGHDAADDPDGLTAADLRQLASDALDAAMWLDRQARTAPYAHGPSVVDLVRRNHAQSSQSA